MPRVACIKSSIGIYHIITRGINQQSIFSSDDDYKRLLNTKPETQKKILKYLKELNGCSLRQL